MQRNRVCANLHNVFTEPNGGQWPCAGHKRYLRMIIREYFNVF